MADEQNEFGDGRPDLATVKKMRQEHPSGWLELSMHPSRALLIDSLLDAPPGYEFSPPEISPRAGISAQSVRNHIDVLETRGLVEKVGRSRYKLNDKSRVLKELDHLNSAVTAIRSRMAGRGVDTIDPDELMDNSRRKTPSPPLFSSSPPIPGGVMNAD